MRKAMLSVAAIAAIVSTAHAHPGHGTDGGSFGLLHYLTEPVHIGVGVLAILAVAVVLALARGRARRTRLPL